MKANAKTVLLFVSLSLNFFVLLFFVFAVSAAKQNPAFHFPAPQYGYKAAAAIAVAPASSELAFAPIEISLKPAEKVFLQYSVFAANKQSDILINALYDPEVISVGHSGSGILITALNRGETLMQTITNDGIADIARVSVSE